MKTEMRIQLNIQVRNPNEYGVLSKIPDNSILPITWLDFVSFSIFTIQNIPTCILGRPKAKSFT